MNKQLALALLTAALALGQTPVNAQFATGEDAIRYRQSALFMMGEHFGRMGPVAKGEIPYDAEQIKNNVDVLAALSRLPWAGFESAGSEGGNALDEVWLDTEGFEEKRQGLAAEMDKLVEAAHAGDFKAFRVAYGNTAKSCKACHDNFRQKR